MHGWKFTEHERRIAEIARELGFAQISVSHEVAPLIKLVGRGDTTVVDAYLSPILRRYVERVAGGLPAGTKLQFMQSNGGLTDASAFRGKDAILSGPAGGVVGMVASSQRGAADRLRHGRHVDRRVALCRPLRARRRKHGRRRPHPRADDADPHGRGGRRVDLPLRRHALPRRPGVRRGEARAGLLSRRRTADRHRLQPVPRADRAGGIPGGVRSGRRTSRSIRRHRRRGCARWRTRSSRRSDGAWSWPKSPKASCASPSTTWPMRSARSPSRAAMTSPATRSPASAAPGGQHACRVADSLGIERILVHPLASLLSAYGIGLADVKAIREAGVVKPLSEDFSRSAECAGDGGDGRAGRPRRRAGPDRAQAPRSAAADGKRHDARSRTRAGDGDARGVRRSAPAPLRLCRRGGEIILDALIVEAVAHTGTEAIFTQPHGAGTEARTVGDWHGLRPRAAVGGATCRWPGADHRSIVRDGRRGGLAGRARRKTERSSSPAPLPPNARMRSAPTPTR